MGRRKKEPRSAHREKIAAAASELFLERGTAAVSMDEIARAAGYSKATLYVYFENKEEILCLLALESMRKLQGYIAAALAEEETTEARYGGICRGLVRYQREFPLYFRMALERIDTDFTGRDALPEERETFRVGEAVNAQLRDFLEEGMARGDLRRDLEVLPVIFYFWGMLSGLIQLAANKAAYLESAAGLPEDLFLEGGFRMLYRAIAAGEEEMR